MPVVSKAQNAAMHAAKEGHSTLGIPQSVGAEFVSDQAPGSVKKLPQRVSKMHKRGRISGAQHDKLASKYSSKQADVEASSR